MDLHISFVILFIASATRNDDCELNTKSPNWLSFFSSTSFYIKIRRCIQHFPSYAVFLCVTLPAQNMHVCLSVCVCAYLCVSYAYENDFSHNYKYEKQYPVFTRQSKPMCRSRRWRLTLSSSLLPENVSQSRKAAIMISRFA